MTKDLSRWKWQYGHIYMYTTLYTKVNHMILCLFVHGFECLATLIFWCFPCCRTLAIRVAEETDRAHNGILLFHCLHTFIVTQRFLWTTTEKHTGGNLTQILLKYCVSIVSQQFNDCRQMTVSCRGDSGGNRSLPQVYIQLWTVHDSRSKQHTVTLHLAINCQPS